MSVARVNVRQEIFWWLDVILAILVGISFYIFLHSEHAVSYVASGLFGKNGSGLISEQAFLKFCLYGCDFFWAYAVVFAVSYWFKDSLAGLLRSFLIVVLFEGVIELVRFAGGFSMGLDLTHFLFVLSGNAAAIIVILIHKGAVV